MSWVNLKQWKISGSLEIPDPSLIILFSSNNPTSKVWLDFAQIHEIAKQKPYSFFVLLECYCSLDKGAKISKGILIYFSLEILNKSGYAVPEIFLGLIYQINNQDVD